MHGGKSLGGMASPRWKTGDHSKYWKHVPRDLRDGFVAAINDEELTSLRDELGIQSALAMEALDKLGKVDIPPWSEALLALREHQSAKSSNKQKTLDDLEQVLTRGQVGSRVYDKLRFELREIMQEKTKTAAAEWKRMHDLKAVVSVEQAMMLMSAVMTAAREEVKDQMMLRRFLERAQSLLPPPREAAEQTMGVIDAG